MNRPNVTVLLTESTTELVMTDPAWTRLRSVADLSVASGSPKEWDLPALLEDSVCALTGWGTPPLTGEILDQAPNLRLIAHTAGSIRRLVPPEMVGTRVMVSQAAGVIARSVAEMVVVQILCGIRRLPFLDSALRAGQWNQSAGKLLGGQTVGVVGASRTGRAVIDLLRGFGSEIVVYDPYLSAADTEALGARQADLDSLLARSSVVTLHVPLLPETRGMIGAAELARLADGTMFVNSARAGLVDYDALEREVGSGRINAALDVFPDEPLPADSVWRSMPNVIISPHEAGHTYEGHQRQGLAMVGEIERCIRGESLMYGIEAARAAVLA